MNARFSPEVLVRRTESPQAEMSLQTADVLRYVWEGRFGDILIEVRDGRVYVNGEVVEPVSQPS